jgi:aromatic ring-opening dioxygenase LigB subunit
VAFEKTIHRELTAEIAAELGVQGIDCVRLRGETARRYRVKAELDHGALVPMTFVDAFHGGYRLVHLSVGGLPPLDHYRAGMAVAAAARRLAVRCAVIVSGDMSHRLAEDGPYGYDVHGPRFERAVDEAIASGDLVRLLTLPPSLTEPAGECGYRPLQFGLGALDGLADRSRLVSSKGLSGGLQDCRLRNRGAGALAAAPPAGGLGRRASARCGERGRFLSRWPG